jgi:hypothetical protein
MPQVSTKHFIIMYYQLAFYLIYSKTITKATFARENRSTTGLRVTPLDAPPGFI